MPQKSQRRKIPDTDVDRLAFAFTPTSRQGDGVLPDQAVPDQVLQYPTDPGIRGLVWNISNGLFPITSTVFYAPAS